MFIQTTINLNTPSLLLINSAARISGKTRSNIIILLMRRIMIDQRNLVRNNRSIQYQEVLPKESWHRLHITLYSSDYECFLDLRKFCKRSVSLLISLAIDLYLNELIDLLLRGTDNYHFQNYIIISGEVKGVVYWKIYWGIPKKMGTIFQ